MWLKRNTLRCSRIESPGCYNTGFAPTVVRKGYFLLAIDDVYLVGCELDIPLGMQGKVTYYTAVWQDALSLSDPQLLLEEKDDTRNYDISYYWYFYHNYGMRASSVYS